MATTIQARTARVAHQCEGCWYRTSLRGTATIAPGHRYLRHTAFPGDDVNTSDRPYSVLECVACLSERDDSAPMLVANACASYCHGNTPCARPFGHDGDHECQQDVIYARASESVVIDFAPASR